MKSFSVTGNTFCKVEMILLNVFPHIFIYNLINLSKSVTLIKYVKVIPVVKTR